MNSAQVPRSPSGALVEFLLSLTIDSLPPLVIREARLRLLDSLGCALYGAQMPWSEMALRVAREEQSHGNATILGHQKPLAPARAALVNGIAMHGFEFDDFAYGAHIHPGAVILPAVLAISEHRGLTGARLLLGLIAGYEAMTRVGIAIGEAGWGFHVTGIAGPVGAAIACGVTLVMPHEQIMRAAGIACSNAAGIKSFTQGSGGMIKRMHAGRAAESGVLACLLAQEGYTAPLAAIDGKFGLLEVYGGDNADARALDTGLGEQYAFSRIWTKIYPCCAGLHTAAEALYGLRTENNIASSAIDSVSIGTNNRGTLLYGETSPTETMAAQYSLPFVAAVALAGDPTDPRSFTGAALEDSTVRDLIRRIKLYADPEIEALYPRLAARVEVRLKNGKTLIAKKLDAKGTPANPCSDDEIKEKFRCLAAFSTAGDTIAEIMSLIERVETLPSVSPLSNALRTGQRA